MPENTRFSDEDKDLILQILDPLNKNPARYETLNEMAKVRRDIVGEPHPEFEEEEEELVEEVSSPVDFTEEEEVPEFKDFDDEDIDELLNYDPDKPGGGLTPKTKDEEIVIEPDDSSPEIDIPDSPFSDLGTPDSGTEDDPFADMGLGDEDSTPPVVDDEDPFASMDMGEDSSSSTEDDPFADMGLGDEDSTPPVVDDEDPFASMDMGEDSSSPTEDDPFADMGLGDEDSTPPVVDDEDPFASMDTGEDSSSPTEDDPFADMGLGDEDSTPPVVDDEDPFASMDMGEDSSSSTEDDPFADMGLGDEDSTPPVVDDEDPFASMDTGEDSSSPTEDDPFADMGLGDEDSTPPVVDDEDPFASMDMGEDSSSSTEDDPFADMGLGDEDSTPPVVDDEDPFASLEDLPISDSSEVDTTEDPFADNENLFDSFDSPGKDSISPVSDTDAFDDFGADLGDFDANTDSDIDTTDTLAGASLEDDLSSLAEGEPVEEDELSDEELAIIQQEIISYPPRLKRTIIDTITNDRVSNNDQRALLELIKARQKPAEVAEFLSTVLGRKVELYDSSGLYSEDGVQVIAKDEIYTKEGEFRRRQLIKKTVLGVAAGFLLIFGLFSSYKYVIKPYQASSKYEMGLEEIQKAWREPRNTKLRKEHLLEAERYFAKGEEIIPNNLEYLNKFGIAYMKIGEYDRAFEKLFGKIEPDLGSNNPEMAWNKREKIPLLSFSGYYSWDDDRLPIAGKKPENDKDPMRVLVDRSTIERRVLKAGAYLVAALEKKMYHNDTFINLARFHSNPARLFSKDGVKYKNDVLAVDYYQNVFTFGGDPDNIEATAGLGKIYYNQKDYGASLSYYDKIYEKFPNNPVGHEGLLSNYIEMWKNDHNPRFVMNHHRQVMNVLNVEDELSLFILSKLAGFYIDLNPSNIRIKYSLNPEDQVTGMDIDDVTNHLLNVAFTRTENRDGIKINGRNHAESYYQRGRFYLKRGESIRALKQFEYAASYDPAHYLAVLEMAEHYMRIGNTEESMNLLKNAAERYKRYHHYYGGRDEDETLINGEPGRIFFDIGKMIYMGSSSITEKDDLTAFPGRKVYPTRSLGELPNKDRDRRKEMKNAIAYFAKAEELKLKNPALLRELHYYKGWIEYMNSMTNEGFSEALKDWSRLEDDVYTNVNVIMGKANAYYYTGQLKAALGNYLKLKEDFEEKMGDIATPVPQDNRHQEVFQTLSAIYNNIGAIYERQGKFNLAMQHYWKAIETSRMISTASEIAMANKEMLFRKKIGGDGLPLLDDWLPPTLESVVEIQNIRKK